MVNATFHTSSLQGLKVLLGTAAMHSHDVHITRVKFSTSDLENVSNSIIF